MSAHPRIIIVDDEQSVLSAVSRCFMDSDYQIFTALSGESALEILSDTDGVELVISDFRMPGMNGVVLLQHVMKRWPRSKRMILSAYSDSDILLSAVNEGRVHRFLTKPWKNEELIDVVDKLLAENDALNAVKQEVEALVQRNRTLASANTHLQALLNELLETVRSENSIAKEEAISPPAPQSDSNPIKSLSERELQILKYLAAGKRPKEISQDLGINIKTVSTYKLRLFEKMGFRNDSDLITFAIRQHLIEV